MAKVFSREIVAPRVCLPAARVNQSYHSVDAELCPQDGLDCVVARLALLGVPLPGSGEVQHCARGYTSRVIEGAPDPAVTFGEGAQVEGSLTAREIGACVSRMDEALKALLPEIPPKPGS